MARPLFAYTALDLVSAINYNGAKQATYQYRASWRRWVTGPGPTHLQGGPPGPRQHNRSNIRCENSSGEAWIDSEGHPKWPDNDGLVREPSNETFAAWVVCITRKYPILSKSISARDDRGEGHTAYVANPADIDASGKQAKPGSIYVDVDASSVFPAGREDWGQIAGPGSLWDRAVQQKGMPPITEMPDN